jgi:hypothetical protein
VRCFLPIHIYDAASGKPVAMILREGKTPSGEEVRTVLKHVIKRIRRHWPKVDILVRGDSHYGRDEAMEWCEETQGVDYVFGFAGNDACLRGFCGSPASYSPPVAEARPPRCGSTHSTRCGPTYLYVYSCHPKTPFGE